MAKKSLLTVDGIHRQVKKQFLTIDGTYRKIKKAFITKDGVYRPFYSAEPTFGGYTGDYTVSTVTVNGVECDLYTLTSSGTLTLNDSTEYWMCGGGGNGQESYCIPYSIALSGAGGGGGYTNTGLLPSGVHIVTIGAAEGSTQIITNSAETIQANAGASESTSVPRGCNGGSGGGGNHFIKYTDGVLSTNATGLGGTGDGKSTYPFGIEELGAHCAGGNSGRCYLSDGSQVIDKAGKKGGSCGNDGTYYSWTFSKDVAEKGGGGGGSVFPTTSGWSSSKATAATFYGSGGGGQGFGAKDSDARSYGDIAKGYQGVCYILIPR